MPKNKKYQWVYTPNKQNKPKVPDLEKQTITQQLQTLIDTDLAPRYITQDQHPHLQIETLFTKWYRSFIYICYTYHFKNIPLIENAIEGQIQDTIEDQCARLEYTAPDTFNLAYFRHTGKWWLVHQNITLKTALNEIRNNEIYHP